MEHDNMQSWHSASLWMSETCTAGHPLCSDLVISVFCEHRCSLERQEEECIVGMDTSNINLSDCCMHSSQGPAVDMSGGSKLCIIRGSINQCVGNFECGCPAGGCLLVYTSKLYAWTFCAGGVWMWDNSMCELVDVNLQGGTSYAMLADDKAKVHLVVSAYSMSHSQFTIQCLLLSMNIVIWPDT